jgi:hypothetical protein
MLLPVIIAQAPDSQWNVVGFRALTLLAGSAVCSHRVFATIDDVEGAAPVMYTADESD